MQPGLAREIWGLAIERPLGAKLNPALQASVKVLTTWQRLPRASGSTCHAKSSTICSGRPDVFPMSCRLGPQGPHLDCPHKVNCYVHQVPSAPDIVQLNFPTSVPAIVALKPSLSLNLSLPDLFSAHGEETYVTLVWDMSAPRKEGK